MTKQGRLRALENETSRIQQRLEQLYRISYRYSWIRFIVFFATVLAAGLGFFLAGAWLAAICLFVGVGLFSAVVYAHRRVNLGIRRFQLWSQIKAAHIARARLDWDHLPAGFHHRPEPDHPFEMDLDLLGQRSVHRLLDTAVSFEGSQRLKQWLTQAVPRPQQIDQRQQLVRELVPLHLFRDKLALNATVAAGATRTWKANQFVEWLERRGSSLLLRRWLILFSVLVALNASLFLADRLGWIPPWWQVTFAFYVGLWLLRSRAMDTVWEEAIATEGALRQLHAVFFQLETFSYQRTPHLKALCRPFLDRAHRPSKYLSHMTRAVAAMSLGGNPLLRFLLNALLPWDAFFAYRLNRTKEEMAQHAPGWMDTWFALEASSSLANLAYLNPGYAFPDVVLEEDGESAEVFQAEELGHPLLADEAKVCNDFAVSRLGQVTIVTGSNMAGKSVFLKTVGVNLALAYAGGPVNACRLRVLPFRLFTSMAISDSVTDGISFFYAEVKRLRALLAELERDHPLPLLFCIDEIFRGTNNRERLIGSRAYVRALAGKRGLGFIATHDLELAKLADEVPQVLNFHFRDCVVDDRMAFDFTLRPGPCPTTNALEIMRAEGLPVSTEVAAAVASTGDLS